MSEEKKVGDLRGEGREFQRREVLRKNNGEILPERRVTLGMRNVTDMGASGSLGAVFRVRSKFVLITK